MKFDHLGRGNRIPIPSCVTTKIKNHLYPEPTNYYTGRFRQLYLQQEEQRRMAQQEQDEKQDDEEQDEDDKEQDEDYEEEDEDDEEE